MAATFGGLLTVTDTFWAEAITALDQPDAIAQVRHPATTTQFHNLTGALIRLTGKVEDGFGTRFLDHAPVQVTARHCVTILSEVRDLIPIHPAPADEAPALARTVEVISQSLGCGLDLLSAHFTPDGKGGFTHATAEAHMIVREEAAAWLLNRVAHQATRAARLAASLENGQAIGALLDQVAVLARQHKAHGSELAAVALPGAPQRDSGISRTAIPGIPDRLPLMKVSEPSARALVGIAISTQRLGTLEVPQTARTWRSLAVSAALTSQIAGQLSRRMLQRARDLDHAPTVQALRAAESALSDTTDLWETIAARWHLLSCPPNDDIALATVDSADLLIRLGRLAYADPNWRPNPNHIPKLKRAETIVPALDDIRRLTRTLSLVTSVYSKIADRTADDLTRRVFTSRSSKSSRVGQQRTKRELVARYRHAADRGRTSTALFTQTLKALRPAYPNALDSLISADFPLPVNTSSSYQIQPARPRETPTASRGRTAR